MIIILLQHGFWWGVQGHHFGTAYFTEVESSAGNERNPLKYSAWDAKYQRVTRRRCQGTGVSANFAPGTYADTRCN
jgi:hypothetical protein